MSIKSITYDFCEKQYKYIPLTILYTVNIIALEIALKKHTLQR